MQIPWNLDVAEARAGRVMEDRAAVYPIQGGVVLVVADGAGGLAGGGAAADWVIRAVAAQARDLGDALNATLVWTDLLARVDGEIARGSRAGETTAVVALLTAGGVVGATVGDSGVALYRPDGSVLLLTEAQLPHRKRRLGSGRAAPTSFECREVDGVLVLGTDGLFDYAPDDVIGATLRGAHASPAEALVSCVRLSSGALRDDVAVVVARPRAHVA